MDVMAQVVVGRRLRRSERMQRSRKYLLERDGDGQTAPCGFCGRKLTLENMTLDHYPVPRRDGGTLAKDNIRPACFSCNSTEGRIRGLDVADYESFKESSYALVDRESLGRLTYTLAEVVA